MNSKDITVTDARMKQAVNKSLGKVVENNTQKVIKNEIKTFGIHTGVLTKFYPYWDKAEVKIDNIGQKVLCKILHRFGGELTEYYTPLGDEIYDDIRKEKCVIPRAELHGVIIKIHNSDSNEYLFLGFYSKEELVGVNPASQGNFKIVTRGGTNQFWIKFGYDGLDLRLPDSIISSIGAMDEEMTEKKYADSDNVYTKKEIDKMLQDLRDELS